MNRKINFVIPWYGAEIGGGAETLCREFCQRLAASGDDVRVLTTCSLNLQSNWNKNHHPAGKSIINGVETLRFEVTAGNHKFFNNANHKILLRYPITPEEENHFFKHSINSDKLQTFIKDKCKNDILIFLPYLYGVVYYGIQIYPENTFMIPCFHKEGYAYLHSLRKIFNNVSGMIFNSDEERRFAENLYGLKRAKKTVIGMGVDKEFDGDEKKFRYKFKIHDPFILYIGRRDATKNVPFLIKLFIQYIKDTGKKIKFLLVGPGPVDIPQEYKEVVIDAGFLSPEDKADACAAALALAQPSVNESFSITIMESWLQGRPVIVNSFCDVTKAHCEKSNGGLYFGDYLEFRECMDYLIENPDAQKIMGTQGKTYVEQNYQWDIILKKFRCFIDK